MGPASDAWTVPVPAWRGRMPVVSSGFRTKDRPDHDGADIDYLAKPGDPPWPGHDTRNRTRKHFFPSDEWVPALCAGDGEVWSVEDRPNGIAVRIAHDGGRWNTYYRHLQTSLVTKGQKVTSGLPVGFIGPGAHIPGFMHLHFELKDFRAGGAGLYVDPCAYFGQWRAMYIDADGRLLPLPFD